MERISRREWHRLTLGGIASAAAAAAGATARAVQRTPAMRHPDSRVRGVLIGVQSYSFRDRPIDDTVDAIETAGISSCELWQGHVEPKIDRGAMRQWRLSVTLEHFRSVRRKFDRIGVDLSAYNLSFEDDFTDDEIRRGFEMADALGVKAITASANQNVVARVAPAAARFRVPVGMHNYSNIAPNQFATPDDLTRALAVSPYIATNLDIGHFTAANFDAVAFLTAHHDRIVSLHIKDRKRNQGDNVPWGQGDTPIATVLRLLRDRRWAIPANIEYEYEGGNTIDEVRRCFAYCQAALEQ
jgi:sugar phosphate isomerase/epimerase